MTKDDELPERRWYDRRVTYSKDGAGYSADPKQILMTAARMERDGWSLQRIRTELALGDWVTDHQLRNALKKGHVLLKEAIARGEEPEESVIDTHELIRQEQVETPEPEIVKKLGIWTPGGDA